MTTTLSSKLNSFRRLSKLFSFYLVVVLSLLLSTTTTTTTLVAAIEVQVIFRNELPHEVEIYWEGSDGRRVKQPGPVEVGHQIRIFSHPNHKFSYDDALGERYWLTVPDDGRKTTVLLIDAKRDDEKCEPDKIISEQQQQQSYNNEEDFSGGGEIPDILILICTQSFKGEELVEDVLYDRLLENNWRVKAKLVDEAGIDWTEESSTQQELLSLVQYGRVILVVASTYGDGDPPNHATEFVDWLSRGVGGSSSSSSSAEDEFATSPPFAVFGLGDSGYANFNSVGKFIDSALTIRGGKRLLDLHTGDALGDQSGEFRLWTERLIPVLEGELSVLNRDDQEQHRQRALFSSTGTDWRRSSIQPGSVVASLTHREQLLQDEDASRSVVHVEFSLPTGLAPEYLQPGDHMGIYPQNSEALVKRALEWLEIDGGMITKIIERQGDLWTRKEISAFDFLTTHVDLAGRASPSALRALLPFVGTLELRAMARDLTFVGTKEDASHSYAFEDWVGGRWLTKMDLAVMFECRPSLQAFARAIGPMQPRLYSIATVNKRSLLQTSVGLCVSVAEGGLCSNYMTNIDYNSTLAVFFRKSRFHFVDDGSPAFMVAAGSGIGPYVGFLQNEKKRLEAMGLSTSLSHMRLGYGCRSPSDILYKDRLDFFESLGSHVYYAFSRLFGQPKLYAQDLIEREMDIVWNDIFVKGGRIFACGRLEVCDGVKNSLVEVAQKVGGLDAYEAQLHVDDMEENGRLLTDCWSVDPPNPLEAQRSHLQQKSPRAISRLERHHIQETTAHTMPHNQSIDVDNVPAWPAYLRLLASGEFDRRVEKAANMFSACVACGRFCEVDRLSSDPEDWGECRVGEQAIVSAADAHFGEEDCLVGTNGSGTIFFGACNLKCMYCQNWKLSHMDRGELADDNRLAEMMLMLQERGCHNINLVSPTHNVLPILRGILIAARNGLRLPIIWNTGGYDSVASLRLLDGIIDIYMPDAKYASRAVARKLSKIDNYPEINQAAIKEMHRQVGELQIDPRSGLAYRGVLVRHLVLPEDYGGSNDVTHFLANEVSKNTYTNVNDWYRPEHDAARDTKYGLNRKPTRAEKLEAHKAARRNCLQRLHWEKRLYPDGRPYPDSCSSCPSTTLTNTPVGDEEGECAA